MSYHTIKETLLELGDLIGFGARIILFLFLMCLPIVILVVIAHFIIKFW